jgi:hypothetical protein
MQLRPVGVECADKELAPKGSEFAEPGGLPFSAFHGAGNGFCDGCHGLPVYLCPRPKPRTKRFPALKTILA